MKKLASFVLQKTLFFALLLLLSISAFGQKKLVIVVDGIEEIKGSLMIAVYNSDTTFLKKPTFVAKRAIHSDIEEVKLDLPEGSTPFLSSKTLIIMGIWTEKNSAFP